MKRFLFLLPALLFPAAAFPEPEFRPLEKEKIISADRLNGAPLDALRYSDAFLIRNAYAQGGDLFQEFVRFIFPISGREQRTMFLAPPYWGPKKPQYKKFQWKQFESDHFDLFAYPEGEETLKLVQKYLEEEYERNNRIFGVESRFTKKIPVIFYQSRPDFEQTTVVEGPIPEELGGLTELFAWKRVTFPYEGELEKLEHVTKHEGTHIYQIAKGSGRLPLWFIEGSAETNSIYWDSDAELTLRDAYVNGFFYPIRDLWQIEGSWLMYKIGNFITNLIFDEYGEAGLRKIFDRAGHRSLEDNLKESLGLTVEALERKVEAELARRYGAELSRKDILEHAEELGKEEVVLYAKGPFFISGGQSGPRNALYVNYVSMDGGVVRKEVVSDRDYENESLSFFRKGASMDDRNIVYAIKHGASDDLRVAPYTFDLKKREFNLGETKSFSLPLFSSFESPVPVGASKIAFIGYVGGYSNLYLFDWETGKTETLTAGKEHYSGLDYSPARNELVFSREGVRTPGRIRYERKLFTMNLETREIKKLTPPSDLREEEPRFSPDGKEVLYTADPDRTYDLFVYNFDLEESRRLTRMKVGARHPQWGEGDTLLFNSFTRLSPSIYRVQRPSPGDVLRLEIPSGASRKVLLKDDAFVLAPKEPPSASTPKPPEQDGLHFIENLPVVVSHKEVYAVSGAAHIGRDLVMETSRGLPGSKKVELDDRKHYFAFHGAELSDMETTMVARKAVSDDVMAKIKSRLEGRAVVSAWTAQDDRHVLLLVNNRLAAEQEKFKDKPEVGVVLYHVDEDKTEELAEPPVEDLSERIQWVSFLTDERILIAKGPRPQDSFALYVYDRKHGKFLELSEEAGQFRISPDLSVVAWLSGAAFYFYRDGTIRSIEGVEFGSKHMLAFDFLKDGRLSIFSVQGDRWAAQIFSAGMMKGETAFIPHPDDLRAMTASVDTETGGVAVRVQPKKKPKVPEQILLWTPGAQAAAPLSEGAVQYPRMVFRKGFLFFSERLPGSAESQNWVWKDGDKALIDRPLKGEFWENGSVLLRGKEEFFLYDTGEKRTEMIADETAGYAALEDRVVYSALADGHFQLYTYDAATKERKPLTVSGRHSVDPVVVGGRLAWMSQEEDGWKLKSAPLSAPDKPATHSLPGYDLYQLKEEGTAAAVRAYEKEMRKRGGADLPEMEFVPRLLAGKPASDRFRLQNLSAAAAYDGDNFRFLISGFADNLFSDRGLFVDAIFLGDARYATVGYANLRTGYSYSAFYNFHDEIKNYGFGLSKSFTFDRYREVTLYGNYEIQQYGLATPDTAGFVTTATENRTFHLVKTGAVYAYDVTIWDRHGPVSGSRLFFKGETGFDPGNKRLANVDANLDFRFYNRFLPRFGLAHRLAGGTSQGNLLNVFLVGGNMSFRGVGFDDLAGQNYWVFSEDLRLPVFDFIGAKLFDPLDYITGFFTRYFDVRGGLYGDIGSVWYNGTTPDLIHSVGYFVNAPTLLGLTFRFSQGFIGRKNIGIWLGYNW